MQLRTVHYLGISAFCSRVIIHPTPNDSTLQPRAQPPEELGRAPPDSFLPAQQHGRHHNLNNAPD